MYVMAPRGEPKMTGEHRDYISPKKFSLVAARLQVNKEATGLPQLRLGKRGCRSSIPGSSLGRNHDKPVWGERL